ncbi:MAG TPA: esterase-like activity of phytase family protein [Chitinophagaceae bacterium]|nr:esterase-like activity of phytase family protein [Chitinophagaceae bacterium]
MKRFAVIPSLFVLVWLLASCSATRRLSRIEIPTTPSVAGLHFLGEYDLPHRLSFAGTTVGGLSGIDYDSARGVYYLISDDRSAINPARFYTARISVSNAGIDSVVLTGVHFLLRRDGSPYPNAKTDPYHTPDPEAIRYDPRRRELVWSSEGERIVRPGQTVLEDPSIIRVDLQGHYRDSFPLPPGMHMQAGEAGPRQNGVFEGMTFTDGYRDLLVSVEEPRYEDGPRAGTGDSTALIRILRYEVSTARQVAEYAYRTDPVAYPAHPPGAYKINGVPDILWLGQDRLLVVERSFSTGVPGCVIRVYLASLAGASDIREITSLQGRDDVKPLAKRLLLNMDSLGRYVDNVEGACFGPRLPNGHRTLVFVVDDNFSPLEKNQFLLFEVIP